MLYLALGMIVVGWTMIAVMVGWFFGGMARIGEEEENGSSNSTTAR